MFWSMHVDKHKMSLKVLGHVRNSDVLRALYSQCSCVEQISISLCRKIFVGNACVVKRTVGAAVQWNVSNQELNAGLTLNREVSFIGGPD